jgi:hypothetical protein
MFARQKKIIFEFEIYNRKSEIPLCTREPRHAGGVSPRRGRSQESINNDQPCRRKRCAI